MPEQTVIKLPATTGKVICVAYQGVVQTQDLVTVLNQPLDALIDQYGTYRLLVHYTKAFEGWTPEAATINFKHIARVGPYAERLAFVNPPRRKVLQLKFQQFIWKAPIRIFSDDNLQEALDWVGKV